MKLDRPRSGDKRDVEEFERAVEQRLDAMRERRAPWRERMNRALEMQEKLRKAGHVK